MQAPPPTQTPKPASGVDGFHEPVLLAPYRMHSAYGSVFRWLMRWLFGPVDFPLQYAERLRALKAQGTLVYVTRGHATWLTLCFNYVLGRLQLPLAEFVGGTHFIWLQPVRHLWRVFKERHLPVLGPFRQTNTAAPLSRREAMACQHAIAGHDSFLVLMVPRSRRGLRPDLNDYIRALITAQRFSDRPIILAPHALITREQSGAAHKSLIDRIFGERRRPGGLRHWAMLLTLRHGMMRMADPLNLREFMQAHPELDERILARKVRHELHRRIGEEERVVAGPPLTAYEHLARQVLRDADVRAAIYDTAAKTGQGDLVLELQAQDALRNIAARYNVQVIKLMEWVLHGIFNRIYDGIAVDEPGLLKVIEASRRAPVVFCPSHRSHIDYLVMSFVLWTHGIAPPHIAAGANLAFFPLGLIFRGCGAFFLRRTFRDEPVYTAVFRAYIAHLLGAGTSVEFFLEGTRSRTGKLLMPRYGLLSMVVDAWRRGVRDDIVFVPVSIDYERIIEAQSYERELKGADKRTEDIGALLATTRVLRSRYGRVQLQFGEPLSLKALAQKAGLPQNDGVQHDALWRAEVARLGFRILHQVAAVASVTPTSVVCTALLSHSGRGMAQGTLIERVDGIVNFLSGAGARLSQSVAHEEMRVSAVLEAVQKLVDENVVSVERAGRSDMEPIYRVADESRVVLDYHKNAVMNYFAPAALLARAMRRRGMAQMLAYKDLERDTQFLSRLLKREFLFRTDADFDTYFADNLACLAVRGLVDVIDNDQQVVLLSAAPLLHLAGLLDSFVQGYWVLARTLMDLRTLPLLYKELVARSLERARRAFLEGDITRPEAANRTLIESALAWMQQEGVIETHVENKRKTVALAPSFGPDRLQQLIDEIAAYL
jgi:glycerol-3-phosphate O-acyltransferase